jgi:GNAT superfamily N-acetyltransferase
VLRELPEWFGIERAIVDYVDGVRALPTFAAHHGDDVVGFLSLKLHNPRAAEIYVMGVLPARHRRGVGTALLAAAEGALRAQQVEYLQVKTLGPSRESRGYAATREFYESRGFVALEELPDFWPGNPCLLLVKQIRAAAAN